MDIRRLILKPDSEGKIKLPNYNEFTKFVDIFAVGENDLRTNEKVEYQFDGFVKIHSVLLPDMLRNINVSQLRIFCKVNLSSKLVVVYSTSRSTNYLLTVCENMRYNDKPYYERLEGYHITYVFGQIYMDWSISFDDHIKALESRTNPRLSRRNKTKSKRYLNN